MRGGGSSLVCQTADGVVWSAPWLELAGSTAKLGNLTPFAAG